MSIGMPVTDRMRNPRTAFQSNGRGGVLIFVAQVFSCRASARNRARARRSRNSSVGVGASPPVTSSPPIPERVTRCLFNNMCAAYCLKCSGSSLFGDGVAAKRSLSNSGMNDVRETIPCTFSSRTLMWWPARPRFSSTLVIQWSSFVSGST